MEQIVNYFMVSIYIPGFRDFIPHFLTIFLGRCPTDQVQMVGESGIPEEGLSLRITSTAGTGTLGNQALRIGYISERIRFPTRSLV